MQRMQNVCGILYKCTHKHTHLHTQMECELDAKVMGQPENHRYISTVIGDSSIELFLVAEWCVLGNARQPASLIIANMTYVKPYTLCYSLYNILF